MNGEHHREVGGVKPGPGLAEPEGELFGGPVMSAAAGGYVPAKELFRALGRA
jgi:hypothetical protein